MKNERLGLLMLTALFAVGCNDTTGTNATSNTNSNRSATNTAVNSVPNVANTVANTVSNTAAAITTPSAEDFMRLAAQGGIAEVELGEVAASQALNGDVKKFAQMMVADHGKANAELKAVAAKKNFALPTDLGSHASTLDRLKGMTGADFDKAYVDAMVDDHEEDVAAFQKQADNASDPDVKAFAAKTLPTLQKHLEQIRTIQSRMN